MIGRIVVLLLALAALPATASGDDIAGAKLFVGELYLAYLRPGTPSYLGPRASQIFARPLLELIRRDQKNAGGEVGALDYDPICGCQDFDLRDLVVNVEPARGRGRAFANVAFTNAGEPQTMKLFLLKERAGWRIEDIEDPAKGSLKKFLQQALARSPPRPK